MLSAWHMWIVVAVLLFIVEVFTTGFFFGSFAVGCVFSALAALCGFGLKGQIFGFIVGIVAAFFGARPFFVKYCYRASHEVKTNVDALIGKVGRVTEPVDLEIGSGRVLVGGDDWKAVSVESFRIEQGALVEVVRVEGTKVFVKPV